MTAADLQRVKHAIAEGLSIRHGMLITDEIIRDRSANITEYLRPIVDDIVNAALIEAARGTVVVGEIGGLDVAVGTVRAPGTSGEKLCTRNKYCCDVDGHSGDCIPPF